MLYHTFFAQNNPVMSMLKMAVPCNQLLLLLLLLEFQYSICYTILLQQQQQQLTFTLRKYA